MTVLRTTRRMFRLIVLTLPSRLRSAWAQEQLTRKAGPSRGRPSCVISGEALLREHVIGREEEGG